MGPSATSAVGVEEYACFDQNVPIRYSKVDTDYLTIKPSVLPNRPSFTPDFHGTWSSRSISGQYPPSRIGHFCVSAPGKDCAYIGYGVGQDGTLFNDIWRFDTRNYSWSQLQICGDVATPRAGARAVITNNSILIFGGYARGSYFADLHSIDLPSGRVTHIEAHGEAPSPRSSPIMGYYNGRLFVWGGFNGKWPNNLHTLDTRTMEWSSSDPGIAGRTAIPYETIGSKLYGYGCSKSGGLIVVDMETGTMAELQASGHPPPSEAMNAGMVRVGRYFLYFGGKTMDNTLVYACDVERNWWFIFHVVPDNATVTYEDGKCGENGEFLLPGSHSFGCIYSERRREVLAVLGEPHSNQPVFSVLSIGEALSVIHLRDDMREATEWGRRA